MLQIPKLDPEFITFKLKQAEGYYTVKHIVDVYS